MLRGFLAGSLTLIVIYVAVQPGTSSKVEQGSGILVGMLRRALSPTVAGVPQRNSYAAAGAGVAGVLGTVASYAQGEASGRIAGQVAGQLAGQLG